MHRYNILCLILAILNVNAYDDTYSLMQVSRPNRNADKNRIRHLDLWAEVNQSIVLNCSLRVNRDQHVISIPLIIYLILIKLTCLQQGGLASKV